MKTTNNDFISDLKLLIDISCTDRAKLSLFEQFHKMIIALTYKATDIEIDYTRKRIFLNVIGEEKKGSYLNKFDDLSNYRMSTNLRFKDINDFLKICLQDSKGISKFYPSLKYSFFKGHSKDLNSALKMEQA